MAEFNLEKMALSVSEKVMRDLRLAGAFVCRWIPVSERLPEKNMRCLVAVGRFNFTEIATYSDLMGMINHKIFYQGEVGHDGFEDITQHVKAWMPLPEPYKAESEDK